MKYTARNPLETHEFIGSSINDKGVKPLNQKSSNQTKRKTFVFNIEMAKKIEVLATLLEKTETDVVCEILEKYFDSSYKKLDNLNDFAINN